jgi:DNA-binding MarR family transcriptional regulator
MMPNLWRGDLGAGPCPPPCEGRLRCGRAPAIGPPRDATVEAEQPNASAVSRFRKRGSSQGSRRSCGTGLPSSFMCVIIITQNGFVKASSDGMKGASHQPRSAAFLLAQVGAHAAGKFAERLAVLSLGPAHAGMLRLVDASSGISQRALSSMLQLPPSRLVVLLDELADRGLLERRSDPDDRRVYALHLTRSGKELLEGIGRISREHDDAVCAALSPDERETLAGLLRRIADQQGLTPGVHPGFSRVGRSRSKHTARNSPRHTKRTRQ